jgi:5-methylcytosine-specific restriction protein A
MAIFFQHVGEQGGQRDFPKTIGTPSSGLMYFQLDQLDEITEGFGPDEIQNIRTQLRTEAPDGFQLWGIPSGAKSVISNLRKDNWLLLVESDGPGGQFYYGGRVIYRPTREMFDLSKRLWGEARFPLIVLLAGRLTDYPWETFRSAFGFAPNWRLAGNTYRLTPDRISRSQFATETDVIAAVLGAGSAPALADEIADETFAYLLDQVELFHSLEGRNVLREHLTRERDPALIREFKRQLSSFVCSVCHFDFEQVYGAIGHGFVEAHHVEPIGLRDGSTSTTVHDLIPVCSNCHRMLHRQAPPYLREEIAAMMSRAFENKTQDGDSMAPTWR